jgi:iron-sulfur cluster assembly protein
MQKEGIEFTEFDEDEEYPISISPPAIEALKDAIAIENLQDDVALRVGLRGGGCAGFEYVLDFTSPRSHDYRMFFDGVKVYMDPVSAMHLEGTTVDYVTSLMGSGFKFINPNATKTCGCGSSFG